MKTLKSIFLFSILHFAPARQFIMAFVLAGGSCISSNAQIVYTDVNPDVTITGTYNLDVNNDGINDYSIAKTSSSLPCSKSWYGNIHNYINVYVFNGNLIADTIGLPTAFIPGININNGNYLWSNANHLLKSYSISTHYTYFPTPHCSPIGAATYSGNFPGSLDKYLGLKFTVGANTYYGWARLNIDATAFSCTIKDYAYNSIPNQPILTGETSCTNPTVNLTQSGSLSFCAGDSVVFTANGTGYQYQWKKNNVNIAGATSKTYAAKTAGVYKCKVTNSCGSKTSGTRTVTVPCKTLNNYSAALPSSVFQTFKTDASGLQALNKSEKSKERKHENEFNEEQKRPPINIKNIFSKNKTDESNDIDERNSSSLCPPLKQMGFNGNRITPFYLPPVGYYASECSIAISNAGKIVSVSNGWIYYFDETGALLFSDSLQNFCSGLIDVHVTYDSKQDRFVFCAHWGYSDYISVFDIYGFVTGFSVSNNPLDGWNFYYTPESVFNDTYFGDYPLLSISDDEAFVTYLRLDDDGNIVSSAIVQMDKNAGYAGAASINTQIFNSALSGAMGGNVVPAQGGSQTYSPNMYFVVANEGGPTTNVFYVQEITNTIASGQAVLNTYGPVLSNKTYRPSGKSYQKNNLKLFNPYAKTDDYILSAFYENGILQFAQNTKANGKASIYLGRISGIPNNLSCTAKRITDSQRYLSYPSIAYAGNSANDNSAIVGYEYSASNQFPGLSAVYVNSNFKISNSIDVKQGNDTINGVWGDYSGICRRYNHPGEFWMEGQYGSNVFPNINWIEKLDVSPCCNLRMDNEETNETENGIKANKMEIYPNPATKSVTIELPSDEAGAIQIENLFGEIVLSVKINSQETKIDISEFSVGMYIVRWSSGENFETKTFSVIK